jgi:hypothetical protein
MRTWHMEAVVVWGALAGALLLSGRWTDWREWVAALGVGVGFHHASVADRLKEAEDARPATAPGRVECVRWLGRYWVAKEVAWVTYFLAIGAVSALVGCAVFLLHPVWRSWYRRHWPRGRTK